MFKSSDLLVNCPPASGSGTGKIGGKNGRVFGLLYYLFIVLVSFVIPTLRLLIVWWFQSVQAGGDEVADSGTQHTPHHPGISPMPSETPRAPSSGAGTVKTTGEGSMKGGEVSLPEPGWGVNCLHFDSALVCVSLTFHKSVYCCRIVHESVYCCPSYHP